MNNFVYCRSGFRFLLTPPWNRKQKHWKERARLLGHLACDLNLAVSSFPEGSDEDNWSTLLAGLSWGVHNISSWGSPWLGRCPLRAFLLLPLWFWFFCDLSRPWTCGGPYSSGLGQCPLLRDALPRFCIWRDLPWTSSTLWPVSYEVSVSRVSQTFFLLLFSLSFWPRSMWDTNSSTGIQPTPPALEAQSLNHWTTREVPKRFTLYIVTTCFQIFLSPQTWHFIDQTHFKKNF